MSREGTFLFGCVGAYLPPWISSMFRVSGQEYPIGLLLCLFLFEFGWLSKGRGDKRVKRGAGEGDSTVQ